MITYELAKELKDAGYPLFQLDEEQLAHEEDCEYMRIYEADDEVCYLMPTLSELIEACGNSFKYLNHAREEGEKNWSACGLDDQEYWDDTPEEAVARLWLALRRG